jgi:hypothetical protein
MIVTKASLTIKTLIARDEKLWKLAGANLYMPMAAIVVIKKG